MLELLLIAALVAAVSTAIFFGLRVRQFDRRRAAQAEEFARTLKARAKLTAASHVGRFVEQLIPFFPDFPFDPEECHFMGAPIDYVIFEGLRTGEIKNIVFLEIKTGNAQLTPNEKRIEDYFRRGGTGEFRVYRPKTEAIKYE